MKSRPLHFKDGQGGAAITVRLAARASRQSIDEILGDGTVKISLGVPGDGAQANQALIEFLAETMGVPRSRIEIVAGENSQDKLVTILGLDAQAVQQRLLKQIRG